MVLAVLWSTQGDQFSSIFDAINRVAQALSPPVATVLLLGVLYKRGTRQAAFYTLVVGLTIGITLFLLDFKPVTGQLLITNELGIPFMMQAFWTFVLCVVLFVTISRLTPKPDPEVIREYTWKNPLETVKGKLTGIFDVRILIGLLVVVMVVLYAIFS